RAPKDAQTLVGPDEELGLVGAAADVLDHLHAITLPHCRRQRGSFAVHEHVDVFADLALFVEHPPRELRMLAFEFLQDLRERGPRDLDVAAASGELPERRAQIDNRHRHSPPPGPDGRSILRYASPT